MGQNYINWARPGKDIKVVAKQNLCNKNELKGSRYLKNKG